MPVMTSQILPAEVLQVISEIVVDEAEKRRIGRDIVTVEKIDAGAQTYKYRKFLGFSKVSEIPEGAEFPLDAVKIEEASVEIKKIGTAFNVTREENLANKIMSIAQLARDAARVVALEEDKMIVEALIANAGDAVTASATWSSTGNPYNDVNSALAKLENYAYQGNALVIHPTKMADLRKINADAKNTYLELIQGLGIKVYVTPQIASNTAIVLDTKNACVLAVAEDLTIEGPAYDQKTQTYLVNVFERIGVAVVRPNSVVKITGI